MADDIPDRSPSDGCNCGGGDYGVNVEIVFGPRINRRA